MEVSLGFHIIFAAFGIGMPVLMCMAEGLWLKTGAPHLRALAKQWSKATALLFVVGAVSGTALSFELGLLWPHFMHRAGAVLGPAFTLEGFAFFIEAIFIGLYLYGWERLTPFAHWLMSIPLALSGLASAVLVVAANAWMQYPVGVVVEDGVFVSPDPIAVFRTPMWIPMAVHASLASYAAVGFAVAGVYAFAMLRGKRDAYHRAALGLALALGTSTAILQAASGDVLAKFVAKYEPVKLAAMEAVYEGGRGVPFTIGGIPDRATETVWFGIEVPYGLSFLATGDPLGEVRGLRDFPVEEWPNELLVHLAFQVMVGCGVAMIAVGALYYFMRWRKRSEVPWVLWLIVSASPLGMIAIEAGWGVTELGRQPWVIVGLMRTEDAVTPVSGVAGSFVGFTLLYTFLAVMLVWLLVHLARAPKAYAPDRGEALDVD